MAKSIASYRKQWIHYLQFAPGYYASLKILDKPHGELNLSKCFHGDTFYKVRHLNHPLRERGHRKRQEIRLG